MPYLFIFLAVPLIAMAIRGLRARSLRLLIEQEKIRRDTSIEGYPPNDAANDDH